MRLFLSRQSRRHGALLALALALAAWMVTPAWADPFPEYEAPTITVSFGGQTVTISLEEDEGGLPGEFAGAGSQFVNLGSVDVSDPDYATYLAETGGAYGVDLSWDLHTNADPFVTGVINVLNFTGSTTTFTLNYLQPVAPAIVNGVGTGSIAIGIQDVFNSGTGSLTSAGGGPIYTPQVDGSVFGAGELLAGTSLNVTTQGETVSTTANFGPTAVGAVGSSLGLEIEFSLTNLDLATGTSVFEVVEVPEPSSMVLLAMGLVSVGVWRKVRRRS